MSECSQYAGREFDSRRPPTPRELRGQMCPLVQKDLNIPGLQGVADESACRPGSVFGHLAVVPMCGHPSGRAIADTLVRSTRKLGRAALKCLRSLSANTQTF